VIFRVVKGEENVFVLDEIGFGGRGHGEERGGVGMRKDMKARSGTARTVQRLREREGRENEFMQSNPAMMQQIVKQPQIDFSVSHWIRAGYLISTEAKSRRGRFPRPA